MTNLLDALSFAIIEKPSIFNGQANLVNNLIIQNKLQNKPCDNMIDYFCSANNV